MNFYCFFITTALGVGLCSAFHTVMNEVVLIESPVSTYIVRSRPAQLTCRALNAKKIRFKCNGQWMDDSRHSASQGIDQVTQLPFLKVNIEISRQEVDASAQLGDFTCQCYASGESDVQTVRSDSARIRIAYIRKHFYQTPISDNVPEGRTLQMHCSPPDADPKAELFWLKDGKEIERRVDSNIIIANDGSLIISAARLSDSGNFTCEARNIANKRSTEPAQILIYVDGKWAEWSTWSGTCKIDCALLKKEFSGRNADRIEVEEVWPKLIRRRTCNNPAPINGGASCNGDDVQIKRCDIDCVLDGRWSGWSSWSQCNENCQRFRTRECDAPQALNGGLSCHGRDLDTRNCTRGEGYCTARPLTSASPPLETQFVIYTGLLSFAILLAIVFLLSTILFCRCRKWCSKGKQKDIYFSETNGHVRNVLIQQQQRLLGDNAECLEVIPDMNAFLTLTTTASPAHQVLPSSFTLRSARSNTNGYASSKTVAGSRAALITEYSSSNSSNGKTTLLRTNSRASDENYATLYDCVGDATDRYGSIDFRNSSEKIVPIFVNGTGGIIEMRRSGLSLLIPYGTFLEQKMIFVSASDDTNNRPKLSAGDTFLSSTIMVGLYDDDEENVVIHRPFVVSFKHCANIFPKDNWTFMVYTKCDQRGGWEMTARLGDENINTPIYCQIELERCHIMLEQFCQIILVGRPRKALMAPAKRIRIAAFGPLHRVPNDISIRVYCVPETGTAFQNVLEQEENTGVLFAHLKNFLMREKGALCVCLEDLCLGPTSKDNAQYLEIPDSHHAWCTQSGLHCSLRMEVPEDHITNSTGRIVIYQKGSVDSRHVLNFQIQTIVNYNENDEECAISNDFLLDASTKQHLAELFDVPTNPEKDWRGLAKKLNLNRYIQYFAARPGLSPTSLILDLWEAVEFGSQRAIFDLLQAVRIMGRPDAVIVLEDYLSHINPLSSTTS